ncbi:hypothetical protein AC739_10525 [Planococcus glaciei]|uniref:Sugar ABC transporter substrate-binding protein n=1 Tax=Planococcus glaciei TaxID=459472 RepID=A0A7H8Q7W8_9BACL|nr:sugar ABC transporter substrate-binding protein [Planococcus glaciei]KOF10178.1 hypothetical protein AC739_10525 [Planococcus glaciei]QDY45169.1 sugar ABC transporter substrate-binding protein [Planococcus glaciei]QKX50056.1 sugar ABC transporter substrate-binding protein [Planococcus glaciei]
MKNKNYLFIVSCMIMMLILSACGSENAASGNDALKIGVSIPAGANNTVKNWFEAIKISGEKQGFEVIGIDSQSDPSKQVGTIDNLLTQNVDALIVWPLDANTVQPALDRAVAKNIPVLGVDFNVAKGGKGYNLTSQVIFDRGASATEAAKLFAETFKGKDVEVAGIGMAIPVPGNIFVMSKFKEETANYGHLKWVEQQDNPTDNIAGAAPIMANILTKNPDVRAVFTYNDETAIGAAQAIKNANKTLYEEDPEKGIMIIGVNAEKSGIEAIEQGKVHATFNLNPIKAGVESVDFLNQHFNEGAKLEELPKEIVIPVPMVDKDTEDFVSWEEELNSISAD